MRRPDFFIVGALKSGTTALHSYLAAHPQVFMCVPKEPMYFGHDLTPRYRRLTKDEYLRLFRRARPGQRAGEASPQYLSSRSAASEIAEFAPDAQLIVMLRNPVDVMHAQHSELVHDLREDIPDFAAALQAEPDRRAGRRVPSGALRPEALHYRELVRFAEQLRRYLALFPRERIHVIVFDDFVADTAAAYRGVLEFLSLDTSFQPDLRPINANRRPRSRLVQRLVYDPPPPLPALYGRLRAMPWAYAIRNRVVSANNVRQRRPEMDPDLRRRLTGELAPEVADLGTLIGRNLSAWSRLEQAR